MFKILSHEGNTNQNYARDSTVSVRMVTEGKWYLPLHCATASLTELAILARVVGQVNPQDTPLPEPYLPQE